MRAYGRSMIFLVPWIVITIYSGGFSGCSAIRENNRGCYGDQSNFQEVLEMSNFETDFATAFEVKCVISKALGEFEKDPWTTMDVLASNIVEALNEQVFSQRGRDSQTVFG